MERVFNLYSLYKKKRKHYIIFNNLSTFKDECFKLTGYLDLYIFLEQNFIIFVMFY